MKILLVVDYQVDFVNGALGFEGAELLDERIANTIKAKNYDAVVCTFDTHDEPQMYLKTREGVALPVPHCESNTPGWELYGKTKEAVFDKNIGKKFYFFEKPTFAADPKDLADLRHLILNDFREDVEEIEICGLVTNMCVLSQAVCWQGAFPNAQIVVDAQKTDSFNKDLYEKTLDVLEGMQVKVINR